MKLSLTLASLIVVLAFVVRTHNIRRRGLIHYDDGERTWESATLSRYFTFLRKKFGGVETELPRGNYPWDANPLMCLLYSMATTLTGNAESGGPLTNVVLGTVGVAGLIATGALMFGPVVGITAGLFLAVSGLHVMYSRSIHAEVSCGAFYIWATFFYQLSFQRGEWLAGVTGLLVGCAFLANSRQVYLPLFFLFYELLVQLGLFGPGVAAGRTLLGVVVLLGGMAVPLVLLDLSIRALKKWFQYPGLDYPRQLYQMALVAPSPLDWRLPALTMYLAVLAETESVNLALMAIGVGRFAVHWALPNVILLVQIVPPLVFWSSRPMRPPDGQHATYNHPMPRFLSSTVYALAIAAAYAIKDLSPAIVAPLMIALTVHALYRLRPMYAMQSGFKAAVDYMVRHKGAAHISFCRSNSSFYTGAVEHAIGALEFMRDGGLSLREAIEQRGCRYVLYSSTMHRWTFNLRPLDPGLEAIVATQKPVFSAPAGMLPWQVAYWDEHNNPDAHVLPRNVIEVFELPPPGQGRIP